MDISKHIVELLYVRDSVIIPGLGGIIASYHPASIDHVQGQIHPPTKKLSFNENLLINDGVLVAYIQEENKASYELVESHLSDFVFRIKEKLDQKEIVFFPEIGRLYKDYEGSLKFLQDNTNFNTDAFGLPDLMFYPILRTKEQAFQNMGKPYMPEGRNGQRKLNPAKFRRYAAVGAPFLFIAFLIFAVFSVYQFQKNKSQADNLGAQKIPVETRINQKPSANRFSVIDAFNKEKPIEEEIIIEPEIKENETIDTESATVPLEQKEAVIIIGAFSKKEGVETRVKDIYDFGYDAYQDKKGRLTRVGVQFAYQEKSEIKKMLDILRDEFDERAWILKE